MPHSRLVIDPDMLVAQLRTVPGGEREPFKAIARLYVAMSDLSR